MSQGSSPQRISEACVGSRCRRRSLAWSTPRSAGRRGSTPWTARTSPAPSISRSRCSSIRASSRRLPPEERRAGMAEVVKTGLLAGQELWALPEEEMIRACAAFKAGGCALGSVRARRAASDPQPRTHVCPRARSGLRLRAAARRRRRARTARGAPALGATDRRRGRGARSSAGPSRPRPRLGRASPDKKGALNLVLLADDGGYVTQVPEADVKRALDELIAD